jgi:hypothetical protein
MSKPQSGRLPGKKYKQLIKQTPELNAAPRQSPVPWSRLPEDVQLQIRNIIENKRKGTWHEADPETGRHKAGRVCVWEFYVTPNSSADRRRLVRRKDGNAPATWYYDDSHAHSTYTYHRITDMPDIQPLTATTLTPATPVLDEPRDLDSDEEPETNHARAAVPEIVEDWEKQADQNAQT